MAKNKQIEKKEVKKQPKKAMETSKLKPKYKKYEV